MTDARLAAPRARLGRPPLSFVEPAPTGGRSRVDLMWHEGQLGLRGPTPADGSPWTFGAPTADFLDRLEPPLPDMIDAYAASRPPHGPAQVRLRIAPDGRRGAWLDMSRVAIDRLLDERHWLEGRLEAGWFVEVGQRGEGIAMGSGGPALAPAIPAVWLPGRDARGAAIPLECLVASFTQPGNAINAALLDAAGRLLDGADIGRIAWREWGSGYGNLTAWLASRCGPDGRAMELDPKSRALFLRNAAAHFPTVRLDDPRTPFEGDGVDLLVIDPPRSGFPKLLEALADRPERPAWILALHCAADGLDADAAALFRGGYAPTGWIGVDAFPGTPYLEVVSLWSRGASRRR